MNFTTLPILATFVALTLVAPAAFAQTITVTDLHPTNLAGIAGSGAYGVSPGAQVGQDLETMDGGITYNTHALFWTGSGASAVDLNPSGFTSSYGQGVSGNIQVGEGVGPTTGVNNPHALLWKGTAASVVDINPTNIAGITTSAALGISGNVQVGEGSGPSTGALSGGSYPNHALLWTGTASSAVDLHPAGFTYSVADGVSSGQEVGYGNGSATGFKDHALLWTGSDNRAIDLNPTNITGFSNSYAAATSGSQQVGNGTGTATGSTRGHALLWNGTAASAVDLNPTKISGVVFSVATGVGGGMQVGFGGSANNNNYHALLWTGTAASVIDLNAFLPSGYNTNAFAEGIDSSGNIVGYGSGSAGANHAFLWHVVPAPEPSPALVLAAGILGLALIALRRRCTP